MMIARLNLPLPTGKTFRSVIRPDLVCRAQHTDQAPSLTFFKSLKVLCTTNEKSLHHGVTRAFLHRYSCRYHEVRCREKSVEHARVLTEKNGSMCIRSANETNGIFHQY